MKRILYHYVHCPFCIRVRMALGHLELPFKSVVLSYDDELTPINLTGKKMLPIMEISGKAINESLDIIAALDENNRLKVSEITSSKEFSTFINLLNKLGSNIHNLAMPYWIWTAEFTETSREYFQKKKEEKRGPFSDLVKNREQYNSLVMKDLQELIKDLRPFYNSDNFTLYDILLASHLWGLYIVPEFQFPPEIHSYLQNIKNICHFNYHSDFWS